MKRVEVAILVYNFLNFNKCIDKQPNQMGNNSLCFLISSTELFEDS